MDSNSENYQNTVSCANLNNTSGHLNTSRRLSDENESASKKNELNKGLINKEDCTRSTLDIYSTKRNNNSSFGYTFSNPFTSTSNLDGNHGNSLLKSSKSEAPLNEINDQLNLSKILPTIGKRDLLFNPLNKISSFAKGVQNIGLISGRRFINKSVLLSTEELEELAERKNKCKSLIIDIE